MGFVEAEAWVWKVCFSGESELLFSVGHRDCNREDNLDTIFEDATALDSKLQTFVFLLTFFFFALAENARVLWRPGVEMEIHNFANNILTHSFLTVTTEIRIFCFPIRDGTTWAWVEFFGWVMTFTFFFFNNYTFKIN